MCRSYEQLTQIELKTLTQLAAQEQSAFFKRNPRLGHQQDRQLLTALCQGAARHYVDGQHGVNDFDIHFFYWRPADESWIRSGRRLKSRVGCFGERGIDFLRTSIELPESAAPPSTIKSAVLMITEYLSEGSLDNAWHLRKAPVIGLNPAVAFEKCIWLPDGIEASAKSVCKWRPD